MKLMISAFVSVFMLVAANVAMAAETNGTSAEANSYASAVLECHAKYAQQYAKVPPQVTATEIATGATAHCKPQMDAYAEHALALAEANAETAVFAEKRQEKLVQDLKQYAFGYTIDAVLMARTRFLESGARAP